MLSAMYQERLLAEYRAPHNRRELVEATARAERKNPVCGDAVSVMVRVEAGVVREATFKGQGCSIAVASASLLTQVVIGASVAQVRELVAQVESMLSGEAAVALPALLDPLRGAARFPARHGCVMMAWLAVRDALG